MDTPPNLEQNRIPRDFIMPRDNTEWLNLDPEIRRAVLANPQLDWFPQLYYYINIDGEMVNLRKVGSVQSNDSFEYPRSTLYF